MWCYIGGVEWGTRSWSDFRQATVIFIYFFLSLSISFRFLLFVICRSHSITSHHIFFGCPFLFFLIAALFRTIFRSFPLLNYLKSINLTTVVILGSLHTISSSIHSQYLFRYISYLTFSFPIFLGSFPPICSRFTCPRFKDALIDLDFHSPQRNLRFH